VKVYTGPFLDGFYLPAAPEFDQWMENQRTHHARTLAKALEALAVNARDANRAAEAVEWWQRLAALSPDDSRVAKQLMLALEMSGNRAGALRHARVHAVLLRETLGLEPDRSVEELADEIAARAEPPVAADATAAPVAALVPVAVTAIETPSAPETVVSAASAAVPRAEIPPPIVTRRFRQSSFLTAIAAIVAVLAIALFDRNAGAASNTTKTPASGHSIAVLPFNTISDSGTTAYLADGVSEELMYRLARTPGLNVASPTSAFAYRDVKLDVREVARRLHVDWILEGSVRRSGHQLRIVAQLTDATTGYQIWSESFDRTSSDAFAMQKEIAAAIAGRLSARMSEQVTSIGDSGDSGARLAAVDVEARRTAFLSAALRLCALCGNP
jgi:TolB-like protein